MNGVHNVFLIGLFTMNTGSTIKNKTLKEHLSLYPLSFFLYSPFKMKINNIFPVIEQINV